MESKVNKQETFSHEHRNRMKSSFRLLLKLTERSQYYKNNWRHYQVVLTGVLSTFLEYPRNMLKKNQSVNLEYSGNLLEISRRLKKVILLIFCILITLNFFEKSVGISLHVIVLIYGSFNSVFIQY